MPARYKGKEVSPVWERIDSLLPGLPVLEEGRTVKEIADALGVDRIYIARVERSALNKMQNALRQFAKDIGLKADAPIMNPNTRLPRIRKRGSHHRGDSF